MPSLLSHDPTLKLTLQDLKKYLLPEDYDDPIELELDLLRVFQFFDYPTIKLKLQLLQGYQVPEDYVGAIQLELGFLSTFLKYTARRCFDYKNLTDLWLRANAVYQRGFNLITSFIYHPSISDFLEMVKARFCDEAKLMRSEIRQVYRIVSWLSCFHNITPSELVIGFTGSLIDFIGSLLENLNDLLRFKLDLDDSLRMKLKALKEKLQFLRHFLMFIQMRCTWSEELNNFFVDAKFAADTAAYLSYSCLVADDTDQAMLLTLHSDLASLVQKIDPLTANHRQIYVAVLRVSSDPSTSKSREIVVDFVRDLIRDGVKLLSSSRLPFRDQIGILLEELAFLKNTLVNLPNLNTKTQTLNDLLTQSEDIFFTAGSLVYSLTYIDDEPPQGESSLLDDFLEKMKVFKLKVTKIYPEPPFPRFPSTDGLGFLDRFLGNLRELPKSRMESIQNLDREVQHIREELESLRSFLGKIANQHSKREKLKVFWTQTIDVAYRAEHVIDSLLVRNGPEEYRKFWLSEIIKEIKVLKAEVNKIDEKEMHDSKVDLCAYTHSQLPSSKLTSLEKDEIEVGFTDVEKSIIEDLTGDSMKRQMVSIVGMPGQGKTHLAKRIYNNPIMKDRFNVCAWCYISQVYRREHVLTHVLSQLVQPTMVKPQMTDDELAHLLYKSLKGNKYLILIDDIWDVEAWDALSKSFPDDNNGSRIMFTSRFQNLDLKASGNKIYHLRPFFDDESWQLLQRKLFQSETCPSELLEVGKQIAKDCKGSPLAIVVAAGILARIDKKEDKWREVANSQSLYIDNDPEKWSMNIIELSYKHLPDYLKPCFLYLGSFMDNNYILVQKLIRLWVAEGFIQTVEEKSLENIAEECLLDLINRSLIIITKRRSKGGIKACRVHDLVHHFCLEKAKEDNFLRLIKWVPVSNLPTHFICEQLRLSSYVYPPKAYGPYVRSLLISKLYDWIGQSDFSSIPRKFKLLRVLDLASPNVRVLQKRHFLDEIISLAHLRYLSIWGKFGCIPSSIANLWNLETFILKGYQRHFLPAAIWNMKNLRHLHISSSAILPGPSTDSVSQLDNLQTVSTLYFTENENHEEVMKGIAHVKSLKCVFEQSYPVLANLSQLESLRVTYDIGRINDEQREEMRKRDRKKFRILGETNSVEALLSRVESLGYYDGIGQQPDEFTLPTSLKKLTISLFCLSWNKISIIGKLPNLEVLKLLDRAFQGEEWAMGDGDFPKLKFLKLRHLNIRRWSVISDDFPPLEQLVLERCVWLEEIPDLSDVLTLQTIEVSHCRPSLGESVKEVRQEQLEFGNEELQVVIRSINRQSLVSFLLAELHALRYS